MVQLGLYQVLNNNLKINAFVTFINLDFEDDDVDQGRDDAEVVEKDTEIMHHEDSKENDAETEQ